MMDHDKHNVIDGPTSAPTHTDREPNTKLSYSAPKLTEFGSLREVTLTVGNGAMMDGMNNKTH